MKPCNEYGCELRNNAGYCSVTTSCVKDRKRYSTATELVTAYNRATNFDKLRSMSVDGMARFLSVDIDGACPPGKFRTEATCNDMSCYYCWVMWLREEAKE